MADPAEESERDLLARLTEAIDELAAALGDRTAEIPPGRVAGLWSLIESLNPEVARRRTHYF